MTCYTHSSKVLLTMTFISICLPVFVQAQSGPTAQELLDALDKNMVAENRITVSTMVIHGRRGTRSIQSKSWTQGNRKSYTEYLAPAREKGTKMLKVDDQLWTYSPGTDRTIQIAGHMLRQSVMGSDLSYEDMMEDQLLSDIYTPEISGSDTVNGRDCWVLELTAKTPDVTYHSRKVWVDKERDIALKESRYASSGKLLKETRIDSVFRVEGRWYPKRMVFKDMLTSGDGTVFILESVDFNAEIPDYIFTKAVLRR